MADYVNDLCARLVVILKAGVTGWDAIPYLDERAEGRYFCIYDGGGQYVYDQAEQWFAKQQVFNILAVAGHATEGFDGEIEAALNTATPLVEIALMNAIARGLTTTGYASIPTYLTEDLPVLSTDPGRTTFEQSGVGGRTIGKLWTLTAGIQIEIDGT